MSHVATVDVEIKSLDDLEVACRRCGLELVRDQTSYRWFGGDADEQTEGGEPDEVPELAAELRGKCLHAIRVPLDNPLYQRQQVIGSVVISNKPYEIGVIARRDGKPGFELVWDPHCGGFGLVDFVGKQKGNRAALPLLKQAYAITAATRQAKQTGFRVQEQKQKDGTVKLLMMR